MKTGKTTLNDKNIAGFPSPQWSPIMKTGKTTTVTAVSGFAAAAAMEPDHEDREDVS